jgi:hypothetical protein
MLQKLFILANFSNAIYSFMKPKAIGLGLGTGGFFFLCQLKKTLTTPELF